MMIERTEGTMLTKTKKRPGKCVRLSHIDWQTYLRLLWAFGDHHRVRMTYDRGELEIMSPSILHEDESDFLGFLIRIMTEEFGLPVRCGGSTTLKRKSMKRGLEPDRCY